MGLRVPLGSQAVTTSNATLGIAVPAGQLWTIVAVNIQQPTTADAKQVRLALGTTATPANVKREYTLATGSQNPQDFPQIVMNAADQVNIIQIGGTTAQAIMTVTVVKEFGTP